MDGSVRDELILRVVASTEPSSFTLYEDDGVSTAYQNGAVRTTLISQQQDGKVVTVGVDAAQGTFEGANRQRNTVVELVVDDSGKPVTVTLNGTPLVESGTEAEWQAMDSGWYVAAPNKVLVKTGQTDVEIEKVIEIGF